MNGHPGADAVPALPLLPDGAVLELGHLVQPADLPLHDLGAGDGFGDGAARPGEQDLAERGPAAMLDPTLHAGHGEAQKVPNLAALPHPHLQHPLRQARDGARARFSRAAHLPEPAPRRLQRGAGGQRGPGGCGATLTRRHVASRWHFTDAILLSS